MNTPRAAQPRARAHANLTRHVAFSTAIISTVALAAALRLPNLDDRPVHADEAIHTVKCWQLFETGEYTYDPHDYHGPTLYYLTLPILALHQPDAFANTHIAWYRLVPALVGILLVTLTFFFADGLGRSATTAAALALAVTPAFAFYSRYYIQETLLTCFTALLVLALWRYTRRRSTIRAASLGAAAGLMFATKETAVLTFLAVLIALLVNTLWHWRGLRAASQRYLATRNVIVGSLAAVLVASLLLSNFLTNSRAPFDALLGLVDYAQRGTTTTTHAQPPLYYFQILAWQSAPGVTWTTAAVLALALVGIFAAATRRLPPGIHVPLARGLALYTLILALLYTALPYKTPWSMLNFVWGFALLAGLGVASLWYASRSSLLTRGVLSVILAASAAHLMHQTVRATTTFAADRRNPLVYAHPPHSLAKLPHYLAQLANHHPDGRDLLIAVIAPDDHVWPLPWYLRGFSRVGYWTDPAAAPAGAPVIITTPAFYATISKPPAAQRHIAHYGLRPHVTILVAVDHKLYTRFANANSTTQPAP